MSLHGEAGPREVQGWFQSLWRIHVQRKTAILDQVSGLGDYQTAFQEYDAPAPYLSVRILNGPEDEFP